MIVVPIKGNNSKYNVDNNSLTYSSVSKSKTYEYIYSYICYMSYILLINYHVMHPCIHMLLILCSCYSQNQRFVI